MPDHQHIQAHITLEWPWWFWPVMQAYMTTGRLETLPKFIEQACCAAVRMEIKE